MDWLADLAVFLVTFAAATGVLYVILHSAQAFASWPATFGTAIAVIATALVLANLYVGWRLQRTERNGRRAQRSLDEFFHVRSSRGNETTPEDPPKSRSPPGNASGIRLVEMDPDTTIGSLYSPLRDLDIRLLRFKRHVTGREPLEFDMEQTPLLIADGTYTALSYHWEREPSTRRMLVNGQSLAIRLTLERALLRLRELDHKLVWVDAVCINQDDRRECSLQVLRMRAIYSCAKSVVVWIPDRRESHSQPFSSALLPSRSQPALRNAQVIKLCGWVARSEYWTRIWIIQEFAVASSLSVLCGDFQLDLEDLNVLSSTVRNRMWSKFGDNEEPLVAVLQIRSEWQALNSRTLLELLMQTSLSNTTQRLDRVFGILALATDGSRVLPEPNYGLDEVELSLAMTKGYLSKTGSRLEIVILGAHFANGEEGLPSWSPNYFRFDEADVDTSAFRMIRDILVQRNALGTWQATQRSANQFAISGSILSTASQAIGVISSLGRVDSDRQRPSLPTPAPSDRVQQKAASAHDSLWVVWKLFGGQKKEYRPRLRLWQADALFSQMVLRIFSYQSDPALLDDQCDMYTKWLQANQNFVFAGKTLEEHAKRLPPLLLSYCGLWLWGFVMMLRPRRNYVKDWKQLHRPFRKMAEQKLCFVEIKLDHRKDVIGLAHANAQVGDEIFLFPGCSVPVILRRLNDEDQFKMVGHAIIPGVMDGELWKGIDDNGLKEIHIL